MGLLSVIMTRWRVASGVWRLPVSLGCPCGWFRVWRSLPWRGMFWCWVWRMISRGGFRWRRLCLLPEGWAGCVWLLILLRVMGWGVLLFFVMGLRRLMVGVFLGRMRLPRVLLQSMGLRLQVAVILIIWRQLDVPIPLWMETLSGLSGLGRVGGVGVFLLFVMSWYMPWRWWPGVPLDSKLCPGILPIPGRGGRWRRIRVALLLRSLRVRRSCLSFPGLPGGWFGL